MNTVGQIEKRTQQRVVKLFRDTLGYNYLGDWTDRLGNRNVEEDVLRTFLRGQQGYDEALITRALHLLDKAAGDTSKSIYDRNRTTLELYVRTGSDANARDRALQRWYRDRLREIVPPLLAKWEPVLGVHAADWRIKKMKTKWGSCSVDARRVWLNLELAKKPVRCVEYLVVHELVHLVERHHNDFFTLMMDRHLPQWRQRRQELNSAPLAHANWSY